MADRQIEFRSDDFQLVQNDKIITDVKLDTKPTTFFKDAFRRFCKNKSSVVGAIILAILVFMAIVVPFLIPHDIENVHSDEAFLAPKVFESGTGFWDGTRAYKQVPYNRQEEVPALSDKYTPAAIRKSLISLTVDQEPTLQDAANSYAFGGTVMFQTDAKVEGKDAYLISKTVDFNSKDGYAIEILFGNEDGVQESHLAEYRVFLRGATDASPLAADEPEPAEPEEPAEGEEANPLFDEEEEQQPDQIETIELSSDQIVMIRDFSTDYSPISFDISKALADAGLTSMKAQIVFEIRAVNDELRYILIDKVTLTAGSKAKNKDMLAAVSFEDGNEMVLVSDKADSAYWACSGRKGVHNASIYYCDFVLDTYMLIYGDTDLQSYAASVLNKWIENGWCSYDYTVGPESFVKLKDDCPIEHVESQTLNSRTKKLLEITGSGFKYKKLGYSSMPLHILGTDATGKDLFKRAFASLRTSLILGICTSAFCFAFGLIWGSISGYFGGNVDLFMERFCEILSGVPWIVIMTLCILHLGNNFFTFFLALCMTGWMGTAARTRTQFYRFKGREYVLASRTLGSSDMRLIFKHILPNSMGTIITSSVLMIPRVIFSEATLAYLNLGLQGQQSFGVMMSTNQPRLDKYPYLVIFPAIIIALMMISFNLFGNGLRDAFNPSLKGSE